MIFSRHNFYSLKLDKNTENRQDFLRKNIAPEHFAMTTQIDFDNQLPRCFARVLLKGETSIGNHDTDSSGKNCSRRDGPCYMILSCFPCKY